MRLVTERKEQSYEYEGATVRYRELTPHEREAAYSRATEDGRVNVGVLFTEALAAGIVSWDGFLDEHDKPVPVRREAVMALPSELRSELFGKVMGSPSPFPATGSEPT